MRTDLHSIIKRQSLAGVLNVYIGLVYVVIVTQRKNRLIGARRVRPIWVMCQWGRVAITHHDRRAFGFLFIFFFSLRFDGARGSQKRAKGKEQNSPTTANYSVPPFDWISRKFVKQNQKPRKMFSPTLPAADRIGTKAKNEKKYE